MTWKHTEERKVVENTTSLDRIQLFQHLSYRNYFADGSILTEVTDHAHVYNIWLHN